MLKKLFCLLLAGLMLTSAVACAKTDSDDPADGSQTNSVTEEGTELKPDLPDRKSVVRERVYDHV